MSPPECTCVCICTPCVHMHTRVWLPTHFAYTCTCVYTHTLCTHSHTCVATYTPCVHLHTCEHTHPGYTFTHMCDYMHSLCTLAYMYMGICIPLVHMHRNMWVYAHSLCTCTRMCTTAGGHDLGTAAWVKGFVKGWGWLLIQWTDARTSGCPFRTPASPPTLTPSLQDAGFY